MDDAIKEKFAELAALLSERHGVQLGSVEDVFTFLCPPPDMSAGLRSEVVNSAGARIGSVSLDAYTVSWLVSAMVIEIAALDCGAADSETYLRMVEAGEVPPAKLQEWHADVFPFVLLYVHAHAGRKFLEALDELTTEGMMAFSRMHGNYSDGRPHEAPSTFAEVLASKSLARRGMINRLKAYGPSRRKSKVGSAELSAVLDKVGPTNFDGPIIAHELGVSDSTVYKAAKKHLGGLRKVKKGFKADDEESES